MKQNSVQYMVDIPENPRIALIGGGSWATAIAKIIMDNHPHLSWFMRNIDSIKAFKKLRHNPRYLCSVDFDIDRITFSDDINAIVKKADVVVLCVPSAFMRNVLSKVTVSMQNKVIISAIKGLVSDENETVVDYLANTFNVPLDHMVALSGPCHAEEVASERLSFLTFASPNPKIARKAAQLFENAYVRTTITDDVFGVEYAAIMKNIYAIAAGICHGLRYGDNFQAVLVSNAIQEMERFMEAVMPHKREIKASVYLGDLLVTSYSQFSRNRTFGTMIGKGYSVKSAQMEMLMIAEGYYAVKGIREVCEQHKLDLPIVNAVYNILYERISPVVEIHLLTEVLR